MKPRNAKSTAERIRDAQANAEDAMADLLCAAEHYEASAPTESTKWRRRELLKAARRYGRTMDRLTVIRA